MNPDYPRFFVYGTLKPGERFHDHYCRERLHSAEAAIAYGQLYDLPVGYPAMTSGDRPIQGFLLTFTHVDIIDALDILEGYDPQGKTEFNQYQRELADVFSPLLTPLGTAWLYRMSISRVEALGGVFLPQNYWSNL